MNIRIGLLIIFLATNNFFCQSFENTQKLEQTSESKISQTVTVKNNENKKNNENLIRTDEKSHFIILIDGSGSMKGNELAIQNILKTLPEKFSLHSTDFVSIIPFGIDSDNMNFNSHYKLENSIIMEKYRNEEYNSFVDGINSNIYTSNWTGLSIVIPRSLYLFDKKKNNVYQTYFVLITDGIYNASNPGKEIENLAKNGVGGKEKALQEYRLFDENFDLEDLYDYKTGNLGVSVKRLVATTIGLNINTLADINNLKNGNIEVNRTVDGYKLNFALKDKSSAFKIQEINFILKKGDEIIKKLDQDDSTTFTYDFDNKSDEYSLIAQFDILYKDKIYGKQMISYNSNPNLIATYPLVFEPKKNILMLFPLPASFFKTSSALGITTQEGSIALWNTVFLLILLGGALFYIVNYIKKNKENKNADSVVIK